MTPKGSFLNNIEYCGVLNGFRPNAPDVLEIPKINRYRRLLLQFIGTLTRGVAVGVDSVDYPMSILREIVLMLNGKDEIKSYDGSQAFFPDVIYNKYFGIRNPIAPLVAGPVNCIIPVDFVLPGSMNDSEYMFPTRQQNSLQLRVRYGNLNDLVSGIEAAAVLAPFFINVWGETKEDKDVLTSLYEEMFGDTEALTINARFEYKLNMFNIMRLRLRGMSTDANGIVQPFDLATVCDTVQVSAGDYKSEAIPLEVLASINQRAYEIDGYLVPGMITAPMYFLDFFKGFMKDSLDLRSVADAKLFFNINAGVVGLTAPFIQVGYEYVEDVASLIQDKNDVVYKTIKSVAKSIGQNPAVIAPILIPVIPKEQYLVDISKGGTLGTISTNLPVSSA